MKDERYIFEKHGYSCHMKSHLLIKSYMTSTIYCCVISIIMFPSYKIPQFWKIYIYNQQDATSNALY